MPLENELISVLMPVRDWRSTTVSAIQSILEQSHSKLELLIIGQRCLSQLNENLLSAGIRDQRLFVIARDAPGIVNALNTGLRQARGTYIARMDDDDIAYPERFAVQLEYLHDHPDIKLCAGCVRFIDANGSISSVGSGNRQYAQWLNQRLEPDAIAHACFAENPMPHPTLLAHKNIWNQLNGYRDVPGPEDHDLILRAMLAGIRMGKPAEVLLDWREHQHRLTHTDSRYSRQAFIAQSAEALVQQQFALIGNSVQAVWIAGTGKHARHWHDELIANGVHMQGFVDMHRPGPQRSKRDLPVITYDELAHARTHELVVSAVSQPHGRAAIIEFFKQQGWHEGKDYIVGG